MPDDAKGNLVSALTTQANLSKPSFVERLRGKRTKNIELPSEGEIDPALPVTAEQRAKAYRAQQQKALLP